MTDADQPAIAARILVVDDDDVVRETLCGLLEELGYAPDQASSGADALDRFRPGCYRLVVTDLAMPVMNGLQLARRLRALEPTLPILMFSAAAGAERDIEAAGITLVRKPDVEALTRVIRRAVESG